VKEERRRGAGRNREETRALSEEMDGGEDYDEKESEEGEKRDRSGVKKEILGSWRSLRRDEEG